MGMILLVVLLLVYLAGVVVTPRTRATRLSIVWVCGIGAVALVVLVAIGVIPWGWK
jgi:hypothetical protein